MNQLDRIEAKLDRLLELIDKPKVKRKPKAHETTSAFDYFWKVYPKKVGKKVCLSIWVNRKLDGRHLLLIHDVRNRVANDQQWINGYAPNPQTYLNGERWNDDIIPVVKQCVTLPRNNDDLWPWAKKHGYPDPGRLTYNQYRQKLERLL
jgi:hypothetical protein